jgi:HPt (histidine-containing phosphotransfer) domain-containing protein
VIGNSFSSVTTTLDESALLNRLSGYTTLMAEVIRLFLEDLPIRLSAIHEAVTGRDGVALCAASHILKGTAASLSANALSEAAAALERIGAESRMESAASAWDRVAAEGANVMKALRSRADVVAENTVPCVS